MKRGFHPPRPVTAMCQRCVSPFRYGQTTKKRRYCEPCVELERKAANDFFNAQTTRLRIEARRNADSAHMEAAHAG